MSTCSTIKSTVQDTSQSSRVATSPHSPVFCLHWSDNRQEEKQWAYSGFLQTRTCSVLSCQNQGRKDTQGSFQTAEMHPHISSVPPGYDSSTPHLFHTPTIVLLCFLFISIFFPLVYKQRLPLDSYLSRGWISYHIRSGVRPRVSETTHCRVTAAGNGT